jgi:hypothetical protein
LLQVTVCSLHDVSPTRWKSPPAVDGSTQYKRSLAAVTCLAPTPETANVSRKFFTGLLST